jgi:hypothetical protein
MTELDVINDQLATLGEVPLNAVDDDHPYVAAGLRMLKVASAREQAKGWWFNIETVTLAPDPDTGQIFVPADSLSVDPTSPYLYYVQRGRRLFDPGTSSYTFSAPVECKVVRSVPFEDLPPPAAAYIGLSAVLAFQRSYDADGQKTRDIKEDLRSALMDLNAEHIRNVGVNMLNNKSVLEKMNRLGGSLQLGRLRNL